ncbi:winged helix-turn-helix domain-containing protein [Natronomonas sp. F2-12]|jgi:DNA-binding transcriptional ArsR family regulator|uniref:Winged helix-turn-helix domain-containing protein n=1 Tax=Natronomonas aquatica TaxID=2841590 RepID=A0A9R1D3Y2_9EURY|nr:winged helix-turn-helix domain-containing protein [Natronomonas aquatica]MCQ4332789.1 winged helix-turn-helix domain-containing protein [Natronomonas aquatica]
MAVNDLLPETVPNDVDRNTRTVDIADDGGVLEVLANDTARGILLALCKSPQTASEIAAEVEVSLQSVCYHLDRFQNAGLIEAAGTRYSPKGKEMSVYALITDSVVVELEGETGHGSTGSTRPEVKQHG